jgi:hypothetical protein
VRASSVLPFSQSNRARLVDARSSHAFALRRPLTPAQFGDLAYIPPEFEWLANLTNLTNPKTRRAYKIDVEEFNAFAGLRGIVELYTPCGPPRLPMRCRTMRISLRSRSG